MRGTRAGWSRQAGQWMEHGHGLASRMTALNPVGGGQGGGLRAAAGYRPDGLAVAFTAKLSNQLHARAGGGTLRGMTGLPRRVVAVLAAPDCTGRQRGHRCTMAIGGITSGLQADERCPVASRGRYRPDRSRPTQVASCVPPCRGRPRQGGHHACRQSDPPRKARPCRQSPGRDPAPDPRAGLRHYRKDGVRHYTSTRPQGGSQVADPHHPLQLSEICFACRQSRRRLRRPAPRTPAYAGRDPPPRRASWRRRAIGPARSSTPSPSFNQMALSRVGHRARCS